MIIHHTLYSKIDYKKYKRVFIFGCSFTKYHWFTWANIISMECSNATEIYNFGEQGGGNLFISLTFTAANQKYKFNENDLILLMWSTYCREDRYKDDKWITPGNVWYQDTISKEFIKEWACIRGYLIRDFALMTLTRNMANSLSCDAVIIRSVDSFFDKGSTDIMLDDVVNLYKDVESEFPFTLYNFACDEHNHWRFGHEYYWPSIDSNKKYKDYHPNPLMYLNYLEIIGFTFSEETKQNVFTINNELKNIDHLDKILAWHTQTLKKYIPNGNHDETNKNII